MSPLHSRHVADRASERIRAAQLVERPAPVARRPVRLTQRDQRSHDEAAGIEPLITNSPLLSWTYQHFSVQAVSNMLGVTEIAVAMMIALRPLSARVAAIGSGLAVMMFATTLTFLLSTPGWEPSLGGFPALSVVPGQFILKDIVLLGVSVWLLGETLREAA